MKNWKEIANLLWLEMGQPAGLDPAEYEDQMFDQWYEVATEFRASRTHYEKCDTIRKEAIASILDQFKQGKTLVRSEQAYIQNGDSGWDWVGRISTENGNDILSFHTYDTTQYENDDEYEGCDIYRNIDDISTDCLCAVADNLYA